MAIRLIMAVVALACTVPAFAGSLYRWVDEQGKVHYSDVAPPLAVKVEPRKLTNNVVQTSSPDYALQVAMKNFPVSLYTTPQCGDPCTQARELLQHRGVPYSEVTVTTDNDWAQLKKAANTDQVPALLVGKDVQRGFEAGAFNASLDAAGYPASGRRKPPAPGASPAPEKSSPAPGSSPDGEKSSEQQAAEPAARAAQK